MSGYANPLRPEKKQREPVYNMRRSELEAMVKRATVDGMSAGLYVCNAMYSAAMLTTLRDTLGYGQIRLRRIFERVQKLFYEVVEHRISYTDLAQVLMDECRINLIVEKPDGVKQSALELFEELQQPTRIHLEVKKRV